MIKVQLLQSDLQRLETQLQQHGKEIGRKTKQEDKRDRRKAQKRRDENIRISFGGKVGSGRTIMSMYF